MLARALILLIRVYQWVISPFLGPVCRFQPSCSRYAVACLELHGAVKGSWLTLRRLLRCHPFHPGGYDPPPLPPGHPHDPVQELLASSTTANSQQSLKPPAPC